MDIVTLAAARKGSGGGASKEYVDEKVAALIDDTTAAQNKTYSSAKVEEKVAGEEITTTATGSDLTLSTSSGNLNALTVYGKSEVVDNAIKSAGEGWATVDLGTLTWERQETQQSGIYRFKGTALSPLCIYNDETIQGVCARYQTDTLNKLYYGQADNLKLGVSNNRVYIRDDNYTNATAFKNSLNGVLLSYPLADTTQGNTIAVKTDNGSGIDGTMAVFETGTPLYGVSDTVRDVMLWDGSAGTVTKVLSDIDLGTLNYTYDTTRQWFQSIDLKQLIKPTPVWEKANLLCPIYTTYSIANMWATSVNDAIAVNEGATLYVRNSSYTDPADFKTAMSGVKLICELATPTNEQLTSTENASIAGLRTFEPQTHAQNNAGAEMTIEAYAGTANGQAVNELKQDVQSEISALKITQSGTLTLTTSGWSNNAQTVSYAHDTAKRNVIDVDPASVEEWASCGILATAETASGITFTCKTVPESTLNFRVTSMGVN